MREKAVYVSMEIRYTSSHNEGAERSRRVIYKFIDLNNTYPLKYSCSWHYCFFGSMSAVCLSARSSGVDRDSASPLRLQLIRLDRPCSMLYFIISPPNHA
ncbi:hypothetical protein PAXRUDRAFT_359056 [Paxillus rubicundulus Ve08.2h10]|uniref:Uncharacterized protein n=1 Tax=Paxillus rubicundulus Ve08.2h10 TaxID=930991 RepID=A0A0D0DPH1_9AGAM|nr:hypothetical protein PAXRUDRAFT_359056 [Paxillus rubicundulus Ve08.2h10]